jgi:hypothetical protein
MGSNPRSDIEGIRLARAWHRGNIPADPTRRSAFSGLAGLALAGCGGRRVDSRFSIEFTRIPQADEGGRAKHDIIEGRVTGASGRHQIVLYSKSGVWWVQPLVTRPFTKIQPDSKFVAATHLGTEYAALLVEPGFRPPATMTGLPPVGGPVAAVASVPGAKSSPSPSLQFSGYEWRLRDAPSSRGGRSNVYDPANISTSADGALHLRVAKHSTGWSCAEMSLTRSLGYGTYSFTVRDVLRLEPAAVFTMFLWDYAKPDQNYSEIDIEISRWGSANNENGQYVVQPYYVPANTLRFAAPAGTLKHAFRWEPGRITFKTSSHSGTLERTVAEYSVISQVPSPAIESVRMNLYAIAQAAVPLQNGAEVVVERFEFLP